MGCGTKEEKMAVWVSSDGFDEFMPLLLISRTIEARISRRMDFVHYNQIGAMLQQLILAAVAFGEVDANDQVRIIFIEAYSTTRN
jgi:hypothetical protein